MLGAKVASFTRFLFPLNNSGTFSWSHYDLKNFSNQSINMKIAVRKLQHNDVGLCMKHVEFCTMKNDKTCTIISMSCVILDGKTRQNVLVLYTKCVSHSSHKMIYVPPLGRFTGRFAKFFMFNLPHSLLMWSRIYTVYNCFADKKYSRRCNCSTQHAFLKENVKEKQTYWHLFPLSLAVCKCTYGPPITPNDVVA